MDKVFLLLGTNLGDKYKNLSSSIIKLKEILGDNLLSEIEESSIYESEPWGFDSEESFLNQAISFTTDLEPEDLLKKTQMVECLMGRATHSAAFDENGNRVYEDRLIDIDILLFGDRVVDLPHLIIPHKELNNRPFALIPLNELR